MLLILFLSPAAMTERVRLRGKSAQAAPGGDTEKQKFRILAPHQPQNAIKRSVSACTLNRLIYKCRKHGETGITGIIRENDCDGVRFSNYATSLCTIPARPKRGDHICHLMYYSVMRIRADGHLWYPTVHAAQWFVFLHWKSSRIFMKTKSVDVSPTVYAVVEERVFRR
jgi:hypothetical protein